MSESRPGYTLPLAHGELSPKDAVELQLLKDQIQRDLGFVCDGYKEHCLRRRIAVRMRARGIHTYADYGELLIHDEPEQHKLLDAVTINVSKFFRNRDLWQVMERDVVPQLFDLRDRPVRIWSAGCAAGEEPFTIAMALKAHAIRTGRERELAKFEIQATDIDHRSLNHASTGRYGEFAFGDIDPEARKNWFVAPEHAEVRPDIRAMVHFGELDLIRDPFTDGYHLIMCRNVIIYFERVVQERLFSKFHEALAPGGYLVLGKVETIFGRAASLFKSVAQRERVFVKV